RPDEASEGSRPRGGVASPARPAPEKPGPKPQSWKSDDFEKSQFLAAEESGDEGEIGRSVAAGMTDWFGGGGEAEAVGSRKPTQKGEDLGRGGTEVEDAEGADPVKKPKPAEEPTNGAGPVRASEEGS